MAGKYLQLLKEAVPQASRVAVFGYEMQPPDPVFRSELQAAASALHVTLQVYVLREPEKLESAFAAMTKERAEALLVIPHPFMWTHARRIVDLAAQHPLPATYPDRAFVNAGGLLAYGIDGLAMWRRVGFYVDKIFKGAKPADLPVERPTKFELMINLKTAKALGITIPQSLLMQTDEVIQ
jgi:putative ABC transport system substrate-binding protein